VNERSKHETRFASAEVTSAGVYGNAPKDSNGLPGGAPAPGADFPLPRSRARARQADDDEDLRDVAERSLERVGAGGAVER